jgi:hypothetical protein
MIAPAFAIGFWRIDMCVTVTEKSSGLAPGTNLHREVEKFLRSMDIALQKMAGE